MTYGGGIWRTWFDRDLSLAGKVIIRSGEQKQCLESRYWSTEKPILRIPSLCIHLDPDRTEFKLNKEAHLKPILASTLVDNLFGEGVEKLTDDKF